MRRILQRIHGYLSDGQNTLYRFKVSHPRAEKRKGGEALYHQASLFYSRFSAELATKYRGKRVIEFRDDGNDLHIRWEGQSIKLDYCELYYLKVLLDQYWEATGCPKPHVMKIKKRTIPG